MEVTEQDNAAVAPRAGQESPGAGVTPASSRWWSRRRLAVGVVIAGACVLGLVLWQLVLRGSRVPDGFIVTLRPIDANSAIVVWRQNKRDGPARGFVGRIKADGTVLWWHELPAVAQSGGPHGRTALGEGMVTIFYAHQRDYRAIDQAVVAYSIEDGTRRWDSVLTPFRAPELDSGGLASPMHGLYFSSTFVGGRFLQFADNGEERAVFTVNPASGHVLHKQPFKATWRAPLRIGQRLIVQDGFEALIFDPGTGGPATRIATAGVGCVVGDDYMTLVKNQHGLELVALRDGDPRSRRAIARPFAPFGHPGFLYLQRCGRYGERLVFTVDWVPSKSAPKRRTYVIITDSKGAVLHKLEFPYGVASLGPSSLPWEDPGSAPLGGSLTRFAPYITPSLSPAAGRLVMLDLEQGRVAWRGPKDKSLILHDLFRVGSLWYLFRNGLPASLTVFDGTTGKLVASVALDSAAGVRDIGPDQVVDGTVWVSSTDWTNLNEAPVAVLDAKTLAPRVVRGIQIRDVTAVTRKALGHGGPPPTR